MSRRLASLSMIVVGALVGACADEPTAPRAAPSLGAAGPSMQLGLPTPKRNSVKYRDAGMKPATGRSGSATISARALYGSDGRATLEVTTGSFESAAAAPGNIDKVQVKLLENNKIGRQVFARNYNGLTGGGTWSQSLPAGPGRTLQVVANVSGIDANRTDVVVVRERVKRRPDLVADQIDAPAKAAPGVPVTVAAVVRELNGDVGARANCVLYVDKVAVDRANGIWVEAGRSVTCAFSHRFAEAGTKALRVEVEGVSPSDWDAANNAVSGSIVIQAPDNVFYEAVAEDFARLYLNRSTTTELYEMQPSYAATTQSILEDSRTFRRRFAMMNSYTPWKADVGAAFPLKRLDVSHSSGSLTSSAAFTDVAASRSDYEYEPG